MEVGLDKQFADGAGASHTVDTDTIHVGACKLHTHARHTTDHASHVRQPEKQCNERMLYERIRTTTRRMHDSETSRCL